MNRYPKIMHVMAGAKTGGAETFFVDAIESLDEIGFKQYAITRSDNDYRLEKIRKLGVPVETASFSKYWKPPTALKIKHAIARFRPDIIQYWMGRAGQCAVIGDHVNVGWYGGYYKIDRFKKCNFHIAVTEDIAAHIVKQGATQSRVSTLHTFADFPSTPPLDRAAFDTPQDAPLLLALARLHPKKGLDVLLNAMMRVPNAYLWIAGDGPLEDDLKNQCATLGLDNRVRFLGWRNDRAALLAAADICVFPSRYEPFGTVMIEAWAMKTPLVAAKAAGPMAYVTHGENGLLVEIDNVTDLAMALNELIGDKALQECLAARGFSSYKDGFSKQAFTAQASAFYDHVLSASVAKQHQKTYHMNDIGDKVMARIVG